jgi:hypothetical protein
MNKMKIDTTRAKSSALFSFYYILVGCLLIVVNISARQIAQPTLNNALFDTTHTFSLAAVISSLAMQQLTSQRFGYKNFISTFN